MKIGPHTHSLIHDPNRGAGRRQLNSTGEGNAAATSQAPKSEEAGGRKAIPPGLARVQARLTDMTERTAGQSRALDRISRNIARYQETQAMAGASVPAPSPTLEPTSATPAESTPPPAASEASPPVTADAGSPSPPAEPAQEAPAPSV